LNVHSSAISDDNRAMIACSSGGINHALTTGLGVGLNSWHIMSGPGTFHTSHFDASGLRTIVSVREGLKGWLWGRHKGSGMLTPIPSDSDDWHWDLLKDCEIFFVVLGPGDTAYVPLSSSLCFVLKTK
jgi:hypothetical protein